MSKTFLFTINGFRELKRLGWLVWLIIHGYLRHGVTNGTLDLAVVVVVVVAAVAACHAV